MKALQKNKIGRGAELVDIPIPEIGSHDLLIRVKATAMCKSDIEVFEWSHLVESLNLPLPFTMGHEFAGEVIEIGNLVQGFKKGDRIAGETHIPCGHCRECRTGNQHICTNGMYVLGRSYNGSFAEYIVIHEKSAIRLPDGADYIESSLYEPLGTAIHALQKAEPWGCNIAILGVGTIGLMACEAAKALGASTVIAFSRNQKRLDYALELGADVAINGKNCANFAAEVKKHVDHLDAIIDMTGNPHVINQAIDALSIAGRLVFVGMVEKELTIPNFMYRVVYRELITTGIFGRNMYKTWDILETLIKNKRVDLSRYVGETLSLDEYEKAIADFDLLNGRAVMIP